jgi:hypothetical protein
VIDVEPFDQSGRVESFDGSASVVLVEQSPTGERKPLGRWDFGPEYVRSAIGSTAGEPTIRFHVELPEEAPITEHTQLWVRLVARDGAKLLAQAPVDLTKPGLFSSKAKKAWPTEETVLAASYEVPVNSAEESPPAAEVAATMNEGKWNVAAPGKPANLPQGFDSEGGGWRASNETIPTSIAGVSANSPRESLNTLRDQIRRSQQEDTIKKLVDKPIEKAPVARPGWAPERNGQASQRVATRPNWSAKR